MVLLGVLVGARPVAAADYSIHWGPLLVADGSFGAEPGPWGRRMLLEVRTRSVLDWIYRLQYTGEAELGPDGASLATRLVRDRNGRQRETRIAWSLDGIEVAEERRRPGDAPRTKTFRFERGDWVGPFSFLHLAASHPWREGASDRFDVVTGDERWRIELACSRRTIRRIGTEKRAVWEIDALAAEWDGDEAPTPRPGEGWVRDVKLYVAADGAPEILELKIGTSVGIVRAVRRSDALAASPPPAR